MKEYFFDERYGDMLFLSVPRSKRHARMTLHSRAAQFAPFAALTGYESMVEERARITDRQEEIDEDKLELLDAELAAIRNDIAHRPRVVVVYFEPDARKSGGRYTEKNARLLSVDTVFRELVFTDGTRIPIGRISDLLYEKTASLPGR